MKSDKHFFSYARKDSSDFVQKLATDLKANGFNIWLDLQNIPAGSTWDTEIQNALTSAECIIIVLSKAAVASPNVLDEMSYALKLGKPIYPVLKDDCNIPFRIDRIQYIDFRNDYDTGLLKLIKTLDQSVTPVVTSPKKDPRKIIAVAVAVVAVLFLGFYLLWGKTGRTVKNVTTTIDSGKTITDTVANQTTIKKPPARQYRAQAETALFSRSAIKGSYKIVDGSIILIVHSPNYIPSLNFDVNQNKSIDANIDRTYGITSGTVNAICAQLLLGEHNATPCGAAQSGAAVSLLDNVYTFTIPLSEVSVISSTTVSFQFSLYSYEAGWLYFPTRNGFRDLSRVYSVSI